MAIRIIKEGKVTKFTKTCPRCGCEFEYEECDVITSNPPKYNRYIKCPWCGELIHHGYTEAEPMEWPRLNGGVYYINTNKLNAWPDCETCPNKPDPLHPVVGDTPCTWCKKNQPYCTNYSVGKK